MIKNETELHLTDSEFDRTYYLFIIIIIINILYVFSVIVNTALKAKAKATRPKTKAMRRGASTTPSPGVEDYITSSM